MNEETIIEKRSMINGQNESKKESATWKHVSLGGVSGILMGAGLLYAGQASAAALSEDVKIAEEADTVGATVGAAVDEAQTANATAEESLPVAQMHNDLSFGEAFAAARAEVGPGGVFIWHGGIYNTYTAEEWSAMTPEQKNDFAHQVNPSISVDDVPTPTDAHPDVAVDTNIENAGADEVADVTEVSEEQIAQGFAVEDVHIVGYADMEGHLMVGYDMDNDGEVDVAVIDMDDSGNLSDDDIVVDKEGHYDRLGNLVADHEPNMMTASMENPDVAPDMPDYMNDALIDA